MISESMKKKYFDRWTDSSYGDDVVTTSIGYNYIDNQEDYEMQLWYLEDPTNKTKEQESLGVYSLSMRKDVVSVRDTDLIEVRDKSKKLVAIEGSLQSKERDVPEYIQLDDKNKTAKLIRVPKFSEVPYPVIMEPNLVIEYYSR